MTLLEGARQADAMLRNERGRFGLTGWLIVLNAVLALSIGILVLWLAFFEDPWLSYDVQPHSTYQGGVNLGDVIPTHISRTNHSNRSQVYVVTRELVNLGTGQSYVMASFTTPKLKPGHSEVDSLSHIMPRVLADGSKPPAGMYLLRGESEIQGLVRSMSVPWISQPFYVTGKEAP